MWNDAILPDDIGPDPAFTARADGVLVTGATGFLGRYVVRDLLGRSGGPIICLVRAINGTVARERLATSLSAAGVDLATHGDRLQAVVGAIDQPRLGLSEPDYQKLAAGSGSVYHCAASVNWAVGYQRLRASNVRGTLELIRFACTGPVKRIYFSSTIAVCFVEQGPSEVDEATDMLPYLQHMPLAYAQSKCVAESLLRAAAARGVPVSIVRPALISGDSTSGAANPGDLICALLQGCVVAGVAVDCEWQLDCVPVDHVARVLTGLSESERPDWEVLHLFNNRGRHWREVVLWMNLYGYSVRLVSHAQWVDRVFDRGAAPGGLFGYRRFFGAGKRVANPAPYQIYLEHAQGRVLNETTKAVLASLDIVVPPLTAELLELYFAHYVNVGVLPPTQRLCTAARRQNVGDAILREAIEPSLRSRGLELLSLRERPLTSTNGIFNEIYAVRFGPMMGLRRFEVGVGGSGQAGPRALDLILKSKPADSHMQDLLVQVATLCDSTLGAHFHAFKGDLGLAGCHERELAIYELPEPELQRLLPKLSGTYRDTDRGIWALAMDYLPEAASVDVAAGAGSWTPRRIGKVVTELATAHAVWFRRDKALGHLPWLTAPVSTVRMIEMSPLWRALAVYSSHFFDSWLDEPILALQHTFIESLGDWWPALRGLPQTLIHNDFNPRNFAMRRRPEGPQLCVFDWELATVGVPQHDLAELLCFVLPPSCNLATLTDLLGVHRLALERVTGEHLDEAQWLQGFVLSLRYLALQRLPLYTLNHRFKRQEFLPGVIRNWGTLYALGSELWRRSAKEARRQTAQQDQYRDAEQVFGPNP